jgi:hypothetical protein
MTVIATTGSLSLRRQRIRLVALQNFLVKVARIVIEQRMAAARAEIERGRERLWLEQTHDER